MKKVLLFLSKQKEKCMVAPKVVIKRFSTTLVTVVKPIPETTGA